MMTQRSRPSRRSTPTPVDQQALLDDAARLVLTAQAQTKAAHWSTSSFAVHKATDELAEAIGRIGDELVEALSGLLARRVSHGVVARPGLPQSVSRSMRKTATSEPDDGFRGLVDAMVWFFTSTFEQRLVGDRGAVPGPVQSVLSIRDELVLALAKAQYVMSLR